MGWIVENEGVAPDIDIEQAPALIKQGKDPQLDKAIELIMRELKDKPKKEIKRPPFPVRVYKK